MVWPRGLVTRASSQLAGRGSVDEPNAVPLAELPPRPPSLDEATSPPPLPADSQLAADSQQAAQIEG